MRWPFSKGAAHSRRPNHHHGAARALLARWERHRIGGGTTQDRLLTRTRRIAARLRDEVDIPLSLRPRDGSLEPLGRDTAGRPAIALASPGVLPSLLRRPTLDRLIRHYVGGRIDLEGGSWIDLGCGWGGLLRHAAKHYGVTALGITLSPAQAEEAPARLQADGLSDRATVEIVDYQDLEGQFDKIASVGMYEHIGLANIPGYFSRIRSLLHPEGQFLNHAISRGGKRKRTRFSKRPEQRALQKYIFPGGELDDIGHTVAEMEIAKLEVHDVEVWRRHYQRTTRIWCERLTARRAEAEALVGAPTYQLWTAYLAGCSFAFQRGSARIFQTLASYSAKGLPPLPPSRAGLYR